MPYKSGLKDALARRRRATDMALIGSAQVVINRVKRQKPEGLKGGFTSGDFVTGNLLGSVTRTEPFDDERGRRSILVGTNVEYALYWELGHYNLFLKRYVRVRVWEPSLLDSVDRCVVVFGRIYKREFGAAPISGRITLNADS